MNISATRKKLKAAYRRYRTILLLTYQLDEKEKQQIDENYAKIDKLRSEKLLPGLKTIQKEIERLSNEYGITGNLESLELTLDDAKDNKPLIFVSKHELESVCSKYEKIMSGFPRLPKHARIGIEKFGVRRKERLVEIELYILEATLFEDMASLWNATIEASRIIEGKRSKILTKRIIALQRATAKAAFNLLEGFLNGLAFNILLTDDIELSDKDAEVLKEWDEKRKRSIQLSLRDKLIKYQRIAVGAQHPPITEDNCPEMAKLLIMHEEMRHALIHPTPMPKPKNDSNWNIRELVYLNLTTEQVGELCDLTIELIFKIAHVTHNKFGDVDMWLVRRIPNGTFAEVAFS